MDFVTIFTILASAKVADDFIIQPTEIPYAIAQSDNIHFRTPMTTVSHFSPKVYTFNINFCAFKDWSPISGPCQDGYVVSINQDGRLGCTPAECESTDGKDFLQQLVLANKACYVLGSRGPCSTTSQLLGYDIFKRRLQCVNLLDPFSPYFSWHEENNLLDSIYNHLHLESDEFRTSLVYQSLEGRNDTLRRQGANTAGIFQFPSSSPDTLLNPCRTGARQGANYKCTNPLV